MEVNKKRGVSDVVTTVLMILLVIAAIGILWVVIQQFVSKGTEGIPNQADCMTTTLSITDAKLNSTGLFAKVSRTGSSTTVSTLKFFANGNSVALNGTVPDVSGIQTWTNASTLSGVSSGQSLTVAAVIGTTTCNPSESATIHN
jgi:flagellin-like protein